MGTRGLGYRQQASLLGKEGVERSSVEGASRCSSLLRVSLAAKHKLCMLVYQQAWHGNGFAGLLMIPYGYLTLTSLASHHQFNPALNVLSVRRFPI